MKLTNRTIGLVLGLLMLPLLAVAEQRPDDLIRENASEVLANINQNRERYQSNPEELESYIRETILPNFAVELSSRFILGPHGRTATDAQVADFSDAMTDLLIRRYAEGMLQFRATDQLDVMPLRGELDERQTTVRTRVHLDSGQKAPVDYVMRKIDGEWKVIDIKIEGVSYVASYRNQFGPMVAQKGLDQVIADLRAGRIDLSTGG